MFSKTFFLLLLLPTIDAFLSVQSGVCKKSCLLARPSYTSGIIQSRRSPWTTKTSLNAGFPGGGEKLSKERRKKLGVNDDEDEYDLEFALENNTDPLITKIIAGSFILVLIALLVAGVVIPSITDYGEGVCSPIQNGGRC
mmetsp:Transcript_30182/g.44883  ORF Transcript_30182/g.44883 Transcript_30182/m.44883 type:complete len:140 (-) Transcript_30182:461-880(-)